MITEPTFQEIRDACLSLKDYEQIEIPDLIIGLTRGGLIPAVLISHDFNIPMEAVNYSSLQGRGDNAGEHTNVIPRFPDADRLLIVDDICDTGYTMYELVDEYTRRGQEVQTFSLYWKETSVFIPTMFWQQIPHDSPWIRFPWEPTPTPGGQ